MNSLAGNLWQQIRLIAHEFSSAYHILIDQNKWIVKSFSKKVQLNDNTNWKSRYWNVNYINQNSWNDLSILKQYTSKFLLDK